MPQLLPKTKEADLVWFYFRLILCKTFFSTNPGQSSRKTRTDSVSERVTLIGIEMQLWIVSAGSTRVWQSSCWSDVSACGLLVLSFSGTGIKQSETFCRPTRCWPYHTYTCSLHWDLLCLLCGWNHQRNSVLFLHFRIWRIFKVSTKTGSATLKCQNRDTIELRGMDLSITG